MRSILTLLLVLALCACAQSGPTSNPPLPLDTPELLLAKQSAIPCRDPAPAQPTFHSGFKYGCFCGANYPVDLEPSTADVPKGSEADRRQMIKRYLSIEPFDDIDALCQSHDVCWTRYGNPDLRCNEEFSRSLEMLESLFKRVAPSPRSGRPTNPALQCLTLISDINVATILLMKSWSEDFATRMVQPIIKPIAWAASGWVGLLLVATRTQDQYPALHARCNVGRFVDLER